MPHSKIKFGLTYSLQGNNDKTIGVRKPIFKFLATKILLCNKLRDALLELRLEAILWNCHVQNTPGSLPFSCF